MASQTHESATVGGGEPGGLKKAISRPLLLLFVVGDVLGAGIYALVGEVAGETGGAIWLGFLAAFVLAIITAFAYAELVTKYPRAAGAALYVNKAFDKPFLSFMVAFAVMCSGITSAATLATAFGGDYLSAFIDVPTVLAGLVFLALVAIVNLRGIGESVKINVGLTVIELGGLVLVVIVAAAAILDGGGDVEPSRAFEVADGTSVVAAMVGGAGIAFYALIGFEDSVNVAEETKDPGRAFPFALFGGLAIAGVVYLAVTILASMTVPTATLTGTDAALQTVAASGPLAVDEKVFSAIALFALANGALINMIMASRLLYGMSNEGILPTVFAKLLPGRRTPWLAIAITSGICAVLIAVSDLGDLARMTVALLLLVFILVNVSVLVLRRDPVDHHHFTAPTIFPVLGIATSLALLIFEIEGAIKLKALILLAVGVVLYGINRALTGPSGPLDTRKMEAIAGA